MGKYMSVILGAAAMAFGLWAICATWPLFWKAIKATVPALFVLGGLLAVIVGLGEIRDSLASNKAQTEPSGQPGGQKA